MLSKTRHGPAAVTHFRSFPFLRHKRGIISGSGDQVFHAHNDPHACLCVFEPSLSLWTQWNLLCIPAVRAPDQQQHQTIRLMTNRVLFQNVHHCPQCMSSKNDRGHSLNPCFGSRSWFTKAWTSVLVLCSVSSAKNTIKLDSGGTLLVLSTRGCWIAPPEAFTPISAPGIHDLVAWQNFHILCKLGPQGPAGCPSTESSSRWKAALVVKEKPSMSSACGW